MGKKKDITPAQAEDAKRLKNLYEAKKKLLGVTQQSIADELDITQGAVAHYLNGRNPLNPSIARIFAQQLQIPVEDFSPSIARELASMGMMGFNESIAPYTVNAIPVKGYPVLSRALVGPWYEASESFSVQDVDQWLYSDARILGKAFWFKVDEDSMTAPTGLSISEGTFVLFDTGREPVNHSLVMARLSGTSEATFKKLVIDGGKSWLRGLNPQWPFTPIDSTCQMFGVAIETKCILT
ncbi:MAG: LexA family protein [Scandinavium sp.]|uniref:LexA family protein n=1 Tax=Scandinavium sp. TaxID=2830653 RepID=UPI003F3E7647